MEREKELRYKRPAVEDVEPVPRRKKSNRKPPKKANHSHVWRPVILEYFNRYKRFTPQGFVGELDECGGCQCVLCGKLKVGFPEGFEKRRYAFFFPTQDDIRVKYPQLEVVHVDDIWRLN